MSVYGMDASEICGVCQTLQYHDRGPLQYHLHMHSTYFQYIQSKLPRQQVGRVHLSPFNPKTCNLQPSKSFGCKCKILISTQMMMGIHFEPERQKPELKIPTNWHSKSSPTKSSKEYCITDAIPVSLFMFQTASQLLFFVFISAQIQPIRLASKANFLYDFRVDCLKIKQP